MKKLVWFTIFLSLFYCKKEIEEEKMVVTSTYGEVLINENKDNVHVGLVVKQGDIIRTENGKITFQNREGVTILIKEFSKIRISSLTRRLTNIESTNGSMLIRINNKLDAGSNFNVMTPTAVAGVRGTTFFVYSSRESTIINSIEGSVEVGKPGEAGVIAQKRSVEVNATGQKVLQENYAPNMSEVTDILTTVTVSPENVDRAVNGDTRELEIESRDKAKDVEKDTMDILRSPAYVAMRNAEVIKSTVVLKDGSRVRGNVVFQTQQKIFVIVEDRSVRELEKNTVSSIEFF